MRWFRFGDQLQYFTTMTSADPHSYKNAELLPYVCTRTCIQHYVTGTPCHTSQNHINIIFLQFRYVCHSENYGFVTLSSDELSFTLLVSLLRVSKLIMIIGMNSTQDLPQSIMT